MEILSQTPPLLPTRVIELEADGQAHITETMGMQAEYITLSYCWGKGKKLLCTKRSSLYADFKQKLPVDNSMPKTFRDALQVTRALGYRYLWIDALCIIQDDPEDVAREMASMGIIYRQSTLTIFAANGPDTDSGLFSKRDARSSKSCNVRVTIKRGSKVSHYCRSIQPWGQNSNSALQRRGWVLQEEVLSGRLLTFDTSVVRWCCITSDARECRPCMDTSDSYDDQKESSKRMCNKANNAMRLIVRRPDIFNEFPHHLYSDRRNHFDIWYAMIEDYSKRGLSVASDKLLAVAGLASLMQKNYGLTYATGLWKEDLQAGLCWWVDRQDELFYRQGQRSPDEDFPDYLAPTWSWASARGVSVKFFKPCSKRLREEEIQVVNLEVSHVPGALAAFGYIKFAKLSIRTKMRRVVLIPSQAILERRTHHLTAEERRPLCIYAFEKLTKSFVGIVFLDSVKIYEDVSGRCQHDQMDTNSFSTTEGTVSQAVCTHQLPPNGYEAWCVPCLVQRDALKKHDIVVLVLTLRNTDKQEYRRVGLMVLRGMFYNEFMTHRNAYQDAKIIHIL
jgi:hypothetical protein